MNYLQSILCLLFLCTMTDRLAAQSTIDRNRVMEYLQNLQYDEAIAYLQPGIDSNNLQHVSLLAYTYYQAGRLSDAINQYQRVLQLDSNHITAHQYIASMHMQQEQPFSAIEHYKRIVQLRPQSAAAWKQLGMAGFTARQSDSAFVWLTKAYDLNPTDARVVARLAEEWIDRKRLGMSDTLLNTYFAKDSGSAVILMTGARVSFLLKDYKRTVTIGDKLKTLNVASPNAFLYVAAAAFNLNRFKDCIAVHDYLALRMSSSENIMYYAAMSYTQLGKYQESNDLLQTCIDMAKSVSLDNYYTGMAINYEAMKQYKPAIASLDTAYYMFHQPLKQYSIGRIYDAHLKNEAMATRYYKRYIQLYKGESTEEKQIYDYLKTRFQK
ncbi:tetratricopeptide repeat protein [Chitinophaga pinensis]|uniref:TPR repeat-containing protein n=1 Tax=Chitinophaga pinensis (strain ATCC 43595 / DSM 2588 / LMG 13176 / NBRC 15968 / NCIMB 11800 / UQM 2034) TaxID=485918 RepID=A0A979GAH1_CHIPD|nr:CDC27 family protein [Chitinophaga pinensis]ACU63717.1 TPR repeat-containing protein [Chitinophaga pinensis DSM 2588]